MPGMLSSSMSPTPDADEPVVEGKPGNEPEDLTGRALRLRMTAEGLDAEYCKIMEYIPADKRLLVRAGVGWGEGVVGNATVGADNRAGKCPLLRVKIG
jgi:hypothetical protein